MPLGKRQRRVLLGLGLLLLGIITLWLACPLWFPWLLRPIAAAEGLHYASYVREGYSRFALSDLQFTNSSARLSAARVEAWLPTAWVWKVALGNQGERKAFATVDHWTYEPIATTEAEGSTDSDIRDTELVFAKIDRWLPIAALSNGVVRTPGFSLALPFLNWSSPELDASLVLPPPAGSLRIKAVLNGGPTATVRVIGESQQFESFIQIASTPSGADLLSTNSWRSNRVELQAHFPHPGRLPESAKLLANGFKIPGELLGLAAYQEVSASALATWTQGAFALDLAAAASPGSQGGLPPVDLRLHARGDTNSATIETARLSSSWIRVDISRPMVLAYNGSILQQPVALNLAVDLDRQSWLPIHGILNGTADLEPTPGKLPKLRFVLLGSNIGDQQIVAKALRLGGSFEWPWLTLENAAADFDDGSTVSTSGRLDVDKKTVAGGHFQAKGQLARRWLPPGYSYQYLSLACEFEGPFTNLTHSGEFDVTQVVTPDLQPARLRGNWRGRQLSFDQLGLEVSKTNASLLLQGAFAASRVRLEGQLQTLTLTTNQEPALQLAQPFSFSLDVVPATSGWQLSTTPIDWTGSGGQIRAQLFLQWPKQGAVHLSIEEVSSSLFTTYTQLKLPEVQFHHLEASAKWTNQPVNFALQSSVTMPEPVEAIAVNGGPSQGQFERAPQPQITNANPGRLSLNADVTLAGDQNGITISNLVVSSRTSNVVVVRGFVPLVLDPAAATDLVRIESTKPLNVLATAQPHAFFWNELAAVCGVVLAQPELKLNLSGNWEALAGDVAFSAREVRLLKATTNVPAVEDLNVMLRLDREQAVLKQGRFLIQGQPVTLTGQMPLGPEFWRQLESKKPPDWEKASARIQIKNATLAAFEPLFPTVLAPEGQIDLDLSLHPGIKFSGKMHLQNARTRPLGDLGPVRHIEISLLFLDRNVRLESASAEISSSSVKLAGQGDLSGTEWLNGELPPFTLTLYGTNVPLARQPEAVVRSNFELAVTKTNGAPPLITGVARMRDSFFLADLNSLIPGKVATPNRRPPYFSIEDPFLADWRLGVSVQGSRFLKVRTPLFNGEVSSNLRVQGTLKDPIALGDLRIDSGAVRFPFGSLQVQQGLVTLSSQDPYHPQLSVSAASKQFGYDIRMQVSGPVDGPVIQFSSTPPLSSEQILLMVTAGQLPQGTFTLTPQQRAQTVAMFFGRDLLTKLGVGDQGEARLSVQSGEEISQQGRPTYHVEYKLSERWSLVGEYDRFGDFNAGFKWRILSR